MCNGWTNKPTWMVFTHLSCDEYMDNLLRNARDPYLIEASVYNWMEENINAGDNTLSMGVKGYFMREVDLHAIVDAYMED